MKRLIGLTALACVWLVYSAGTVAAQEAEQLGLKHFETKIRPVLVEHCYGCHSSQAAEEKKLKGGLLLDSREGALRGGDSGPAIVPGKPDDSLLLSALKQETFEMPPKGKLSDAVIADFEWWIKLGAPDPREGTKTASRAAIDLEAGRRFWSFQPLARVEPPDVKDTAWVRTPIDRFIRAPQEGADLKPNSVADPRTLVRRAWFDLLGLPPTPEEMRTWMRRLSASDSNSGERFNDAAYGELIDHLLASPHYGERWARHWMDVARFAESHGYEQDYDRPHAYHYRDFLIKAFNADMPYDQFVRWQLAGDELAPDNHLALMATGFLGAGAFPTQLTETEFERARYDELDDMVATTGVAFLGLSTGCARCHDHKFDPIPSHDYYRLAATFTTAIRSEIEIDQQPQENARRRARYDLRVDELTRKLQRLAQDSTDSSPAALLEEWRLVQQLAQVRKTGPSLQLTKVMITSEGCSPMKHHADGRGFPHFYPQTFFLRRGDVHQKGEIAAPGFLRVLLRDAHGPEQYQIHSSEKQSPRTSFRRAVLAHWITDADHGAGHLAGRVIVNRLWQHHFGRGIVATPNDFGTQGERPTHPELLDWLAADLIEHGWCLKRLHKLIMTSSVYLQSIDHDDRRAKIDRDNLLIWRRVPRRLEAEAIRDSLLAVSGQLDGTMYGPGTLDPNMRRRSIYFFIKRSQLIPMMMLFDWPEHLVSIAQRSSTTIAPQALLFLNSPQARGYAEGLARRVAGSEDGETERDREGESQIHTAYWFALGREPSRTEERAAPGFMTAQVKAYGEQGVEPAEAVRRAWIDFCQTLLAMNEFLYVD